MDPKPDDDREVNLEDDEFIVDDETPEDDPEDALLEEYGL